LGITLLKLKKLRDLDLAAPPQPGRPQHLSAASGLIVAGKYLYAIADDELSLGVFDAGHAKPGSVIRLLPGELPLDPKERKAAKADFESLVRLPAFAGFEHGALFALSSGSKKKNRHVGVVIALGNDGAATGQVVPIDLSELYEPLHREFARLNIEGAVIGGDEIRLFQRGNSKDRINAIVRCKLRPILDAIGMGCGIGKAELLAVVPVELGELDGVPLSFTDAAILQDGNMIFSAAAEDTEDAYDDGNCTGSAVGIVGPQGNIVFLEQTEQELKLEGIAVAEHNDAIEMLLVSDADDANIPASLFSTRIG
jgi:hypothetical protein